MNARGNMPDNSCCSCKFVIYEINKDDTGTDIICLKNHEITERMVINEHCNEYIRRMIL